MRKLKAVSVALLVVASAGLAFGSMGFSSVAADRGVSVSVVNDSSAFVGYETDERTITDGDRVDLVTLENRFTSSVNITDVTVTGVNASSIKAGGQPLAGSPTLDSGNNTIVSAIVECSPGSGGDIEVTVEVDGNYVSASIDGETRAFDFTCEQPNDGGVSNVKFHGNSKFTADTADEPEVKYWTSSDHGTFSERNGTFTGELKPGGGVGVVAVYFLESSTTYVHPGFDAGTGEVSNSGQSNQQACQFDGEYDPTTAETNACTGESSPGNSGNSSDNRAN